MAAFHRLPIPQIVRRTMPATVIASLALICLMTASGLAQSPEPASPGPAPTMAQTTSDDLSDPAGDLVDKDAVWNAWWRFRMENGEGWLVRWRRETGCARMLFGQHTAAPATAPTRAADFESQARELLAEYADLFGVRPQDLELVGVNRSQLSSIGTTDKIGVQFRQVIEGIDVHRSWITVLFLENGSMVAIHAEVLPDAPQAATWPRISEEAARQLAAADLAAREAARDLEAIDAEPLIYAAREGHADRARLAWMIEVRGASTSRPGMPVGERIFVDALTGEVIGSEGLVHQVDLYGTIDGWATPGTLPDTGSNPEVRMPMGRLDVSATGVGTTTTDMNGDFIFPGVSPGTYNVSAQLYGNYCDVQNQQGSDASVSGNIDAGAGGTLTFNTSKTEERTAEVNAQYWVIALREWMLGIDPSFDPMGFRLTANVNMNNTCNAYYNGSSLNFFQSGGGCVNTSYSTVVNHEEGHWINDMAGSGNGGDGFGEGSADVWSMYLTDQPIVGEDFCGSGCNIRDGRNTRQFCGDSNPGCYGEVHRDGEPLMGAMWKVRDRLNTSLGDAAGDAVADAIFIAWYKQYDDGQIRSWVRDHWLVLDDDDGNVNNGTPHYADIEGGFTDQGWPPFEIDAISITHTPLPDTQDQTGPYTAVASVISNVGSTITSVELRYDVGGGWTTVTMTPTGNPDEYSGDIPGQPAPTVVSYYIWAQDNLGNSNTAPAGAPSAGTYTFDVGVRGAPFYFDDFETSSGWTHNGSGQDDWQLGTPQGKVEDPSSAYSGANCWGNDLGGSGWNGAYSNNVDNYLTSPSIDCSGRLGVRLELQRWLAVEKGIYDQAQIEVSVGGGSYTTVWANENGTDHIDTSWQAMEVNISTLADNQSNVKVRFHLITDGGVTFGGWNLDDCGLSALEAPGDSTPPVGPTGLDSPTHSVGVWSQNPTVEMTWTPATDDSSGLDGYSVLWDQSATTTPDHVKDIEETATNYIETLSSSNSGWYFHIVPVDNAGNWGSAVHFGPVLIDTTAPDPPTGLTSPSHTPGQWSQSRTVTVDWTPAVDPVGAGLDGYSLVWDHAATTDPDQVKDIEETVTEDVSTLDPSSQGWYFHIRSVDNVGNWGSSTHYGPILIDDVAPSGTILIEGDAAATQDLFVDLDLSAADSESGMGSGATMSFSNDGTTWSPEEPYASTRSAWDLSQYGGSIEPGTKTVYVIFKDVAGNASAVDSDTIEYEPLPVIDSLDPTSGPFGGGTDVTISGSGYTPASVVTFGGIPATVSYVDSTTLVATTPSALPWVLSMTFINPFFLPVDVTVQTAFGSDTQSNGFVYQR